VQDASSKQAKQKHKCNHRKIIFPQSPQNILPHTALPIREKKAFSYQNTGKKQNKQTKNLHKPLDQTHPLRAENKRKKKYNPKAWEKEISNTVS